MSGYQRHIGYEKTRDEIKKIYHNPGHKALNILESVETQCNWLREIGFAEVDCYMKIFELALFGGIRKRYENNMKNHQPGSCGTVNKGF